MTYVVKNNYEASDVMSIEVSTLDKALDSAWAMAYDILSAFALRDRMVAWHIMERLQALEGSIGHTFELNVCYGYTITISKMD